MKVAILGYGKMGHELERLFVEAGDEVVTKIDNEEDWKNQGEALRTADVAVEFSMPTTAVSNLFRCFDAYVPVVCGTTGWANDADKVLEKCKATSNALVYGANFSIGANLFFKINELLAKMMNNQPQYEVTVEETHHAQKKDAPSGTAITTANLIINQLDRKNGWFLNDAAAAVQEDKIAVTAHRLGNEAGTHIVHYQSDSDYLEITHKAFSRTIFAQGAVRAAHWLVNNKGIYLFNDIFMQI